MLWTERPESILPGMAEKAAPMTRPGTRYLLRNMEKVPEGSRGARFVSVITMALPGIGTVISARGELAGEILRQEQGDGGFGYDPLFYIPSEGCTMAELTAERKNEISHRAVALRNFVEKLR